MNILNRLGEVGTVLDLCENNLWGNSAKQNRIRKKNKRLQCFSCDIAFKMKCFSFR